MPPWSCPAVTGLGLWAEPPTCLRLATPPAPQRLPKTYDATYLQPLSLPCPPCCTPLPCAPPSRTKPQSSSLKNGASLQHLPGLGPGGTSGKAGRTRGPRSVPSPPHYPSLFPQRPQRAQIFSTLSGGVTAPGGVSSRHCWGSGPDIKAPVCVPRTKNLLCFTPTFLHLCPPFMSSLVSSSSWSGFSHSFSHLLYLPPPLAHFSTSLSSCVSAFFSYNPVHLDNFHLDYLT